MNLGKSLRKVLEVLEAFRLFVMQSPRRTRLAREELRSHLPSNLQFCSFP